MFWCSCLQILGWRQQIVCGFEFTFHMSTFGILEDFLDKSYLCHFLLYLYLLTHQMWLLVRWMRALRLPVHILYMWTSSTYIIYVAAKKLTPVNMLKLWAIGVELDHPARNNFVNRGCPEVILCRPSSYNSPLLVQSVHCCSVLLWSVLSKLFFAVQWGFPKAGGEEGIYIRQTTCICLAQPFTSFQRHVRVLYCTDEGTY